MPWSATAGASRAVSDTHRVLVHAGPLTTEKHGIQAGSLVASGRHQDTLSRLHAELRHAGPGIEET